MPTARAPASLAWAFPFVASIVVLLAGCADVPTTPAPAPAAPSRARTAEPVAPTIAAWRQRAAAASAAGDLALAETSWHVLTLLAPEEASYRQELAATRAAIRRGVDEALQAGNNALKSGDADRASTAFLRVLALDPDNADAARALREIDRRKLARVQADRAARARVEEPATRSLTPRSAPANDINNGTYDLEQALELFNAGDTNSGLRDLRSWVDAHPQDRAARARIGATVFDRGSELEKSGAREQALALYEAAITLRGEPGNGWAARVQTLRKTLSNDYYDKGTRAERSDLEAAVKALEASVRYDPTNVKASARLAQAKTALAKLKQMESAPGK